MRTLKELYELTLHETERTLYPEGICLIITFMRNMAIITDEERWALRDDFRSKRPKWYSKFYWSSSFKENSCGYWWSINQEGMKERIKFLKHIIKNLN